MPQLQAARPRDATLPTYRLSLGRTGAANHIFLPHPAKSLRNHPAPGRPKWARDAAMEWSLAPEERRLFGSPIVVWYCRYSRQYSNASDTVARLHDVTEAPAHKTKPSRNGKGPPYAEGLGQAPCSLDREDHGESSSSVVMGMARWAKPGRRTQISVRLLVWASKFVKLQSANLLLVLPAIRQEQQLGVLAPSPFRHIVIPSFYYRGVG